ncbi:MAG: hypothetical protein WD995_00840 [Gemmatimonadota bacterium]
MAEEVKDPGRALPRILVGGTVVILASLVIFVSSANVNFLGLPRVAYGLAQNGLAPRQFGKLDDRSTPRNGLTFIATSLRRRFIERLRPFALHPRP